MKICVVTPYFRTPTDWLIQAHRSVREQSVPASHILVCDGSPPAPIPDFFGTHIILERNYGDYGNTPRLIGCYQAVMQEAEAIAFLDGDNWFHPDHLAGLVNMAETHSLDIVSSARMLHRLDGSPMLRCPHVDGVRYIDTNCLLVMKPAFRNLISWVLTSQEAAAQGDQRLWSFMKAQGARMGFLNQASIAYRTRHRVHYELANEMPPPDAITRSDLHGANYH
ncbi:MAG: glycosyltransferase family 2 protein [Acetobacteraceae bacterium]